MQNIMDAGRAARGPSILIADDHPIMRSALRAALAELSPAPRFLEAGDAAAVVALVGEHPDLDLVLLDLHMPGVGTVGGVRALRERIPEIPVAVVSGEDEPGVAAELLRIGVAGYIPKTDAPVIIVSAVRLMLAGGVYAPTRLLRAAPPTAPGPANGSGLTDRQLEVIRLLAKGQSNKEIARELGITEGTVKVHLLSVFRVLGVRNRTAAVVTAQRYLG
jgi:DNA-binding NarL/FixJ family response regulator